MSEAHIPTRREIKYYVDARTQARFRGLLQAILTRDEHGEPERGYGNYSIYFDSPTRMFCVEKNEGLSFRTKPRLRIYRKLSDFSPTAYFFEFKNRLGQFVSKERTIIEKEVAEKLLDPFQAADSQIEKGSPILAKFIYLMRRHNLRPMATVFYQREAFSSPIYPGLRITFDRAISANCDISLNTPAEMFCPIIQPNMVIIEVKYNGRFPNTIQQVVHRLNLQQVSISKYVTAAEKLFRGKWI